MKAVCWNGVKDVRVERMPDPEIVNPRDIIVRVTATAICGSDLHLYDGYIPTMKPGDILGHEFMGEVVETGFEITDLKPGDRVVVPFTIACGACFFCARSLYACCDNSMPADKADISETLYGYSPAGIFGYSHMMGGYSGGQAEYVRVPFADVGPIKVPEGVSDERALFLSDIFPTGYMAAENCDIKQGDTVAVWGCGPVGQFAIRSAFLLGAERVVAIDHHVSRLELARGGGADVINFIHTNVKEALDGMTAGRGPDACIDAVGLESHGWSVDNIADFAKKAVLVGADRPHVLREAIQCCRKGGVVSVPGVYGGLLDMMPIGAAFGKGLTLRMGQTHMQRYMRPLMDLVASGKIDPSFIISHRLALDDAPQGYRDFKNKQNDVTKVVMRPLH